MSDLDCVREQIADIRERVAAIEPKVDTALELLREHRNNHFQFSLMAWGAIVCSIGAVVTALVV